MSGNGLEWLPQPRGKYLTAVTASIETEEEAWEEARFRQDALANTNWPSFNDPWDRREELGETARVLSRRFAKAQKAGVSYPSLAHPVWMRDRRLALGGACHRASDVLGGLDTTATIMPATWCFGPEQVHDLNPRQLLNAIYMMLYRYGGNEAKGFLLAALHGEYDETRQKLWLHLHLWLGGEMVDVLDELRRSKRIQGPKRIVDGKLKKRRAIRIRRKPLFNRPEPYTYVLQSFWPSRVFIHPETEASIRGQRRRIPEPVHTDVLLWLERWQLADITFSMGLKATSKGLAFTRRM